MLKAAAVFSDHMVLQRDGPIAVFGRADGEVTVCLAGKSVSARLAEGRFEAFLPPMPAGGPYELTIRSGNDEIVFRDVMIGEVWLCGGQSNMELRLRDARDGREEAARGGDPLLRFYETPPAARPEEADEKEQYARWKALAPGRCGDVSAIAYFAGRRLREVLNVPVGMLVCCLGGTQISHWLSRDALSSFPEGQSCLEDFEREIAGISDAQFERNSADYWGKVAAYNDAWDQLRKTRPDLGMTEIAALLGDYPWPPPSGRWMLHRPAGLWENMVERIMPFSVRGLFWYQGESDSGHADRYETLFRRLIREWRSAFQNEGMYVVAAQLPGFGADPAAENWPGIRAAQQRVCDDMPGCALACLMDCGEKDNIHPVDKRTPGRRMAALALHMAYGLPVSCSMPRLTDAKYEGGRAMLRFSAPLGSLGEKRDSLKVDGRAAEEMEVSGDQLILRADASCIITYGQENAPDACLFGLDGDPAFPFTVRVE